MHKLEELREMLMEELNECVKKDELSTASLDIIDKLTHSIKSIDTIIAMEEADYSYDGGSYARGRDGRGRGRNAKRDSMGRYARRGGSYDESYDDGSYDDGSYGRDGSYGYARRGRGYSRAEAKDELMNELREIQMDAKDEESKQMIKQWIKQLEQN